MKKLRKSISTQIPAKDDSFNFFIMTKSLNRLTCQVQEKPIWFPGADFLSTEDLSHTFITLNIICTKMIFV
ncbi:MAG TPA: hypothetical protein PK683_18705, partial [Leptospiraceae bacterium]|nr:hypothetical protein [Leptospiraceae bacterium]